MAELVDALVLGTDRAICEGSSPFRPTINIFYHIILIMIVSPCISICKTDPSTGYCYGCGRNNEEKKIWKLEETSEMWKKENIEIIKKRLTGWQLESFEESYTYKIENGISLYKKNLKK